LTDAAFLDREVTDNGSPGKPKPFVRRQRKSAGLLSGDCRTSRKIFFFFHCRGAEDENDVTYSDLGPDRRICIRSEENLGVVSTHFTESSSDGVEILIMNKMGRIDNAECGVQI
jgi:hypothetical protein